MHATSFWLDRGSKTSPASLHHSSPKRFAIHSSSTLNVLGFQSSSIRIKMSKQSLCKKEDNGFAKNQEASHGEAWPSSNSAAAGVQLVSSCKPNKISSLFSSFDYEKANLVKSTGFGGLLHMPSLNLNLDLCLWLLQCFDYNNECLHLPSGVDVPLRIRDVDIVFGIPYEGYPVHVNHLQSFATISAFSDKLCKTNNSPTLTLAFVENILTKEYVSPMSTQERVAFNIATVLYAVAYLLAPEPTPRFPIELLENFVNDVQLSEINWASLVFWTIHRASIEARKQVNNGSKKITLFGCCLFLQVFYIDNLNFGPPAPNHSMLPRTSAYLPEYMSAIILEDCIGRSTENLMLFGKTELRPTFGVCYTRGWMDNPDEQSQDDCIRILDLFKEGAQLLDKISVQSSQLMQTIDAENTLQQTRKSFLTFKSKICTAVNHIPMPRRPISQKQFSLGILNRPITKRPQLSGNERHKAVERGAVQRLLHIVSKDPSPKLVVEAEDIPCTSKNIQPNLAVPFKPSQFDIGHSYSCNVELSSLQRKTMSSHSNFRASFCEQMFEHPAVSSDNKYRCYLWMTDREMNWTEASRIWIAFNSPQTLNISGNVVRQCLKLNGPFTVSMVDAIMVVWSYLDAKMSKYYNDIDEPHYIWRHFLPASFAEMVNGNTDYLNSNLVQSTFLGKHISYKVEDCQQIILPVLANDHTWSCYFWDFKTKTISILDPVLQKCAESKAIEKHHDTVIRLHNALFACKDHFFSGWNIEANGWNEVYLTKLSHRCSPENSGLYAVHYARTFCGPKVLFWPLKKEEEPNLCYPRGEIMYHLVTCPQNKGYKSENLKESIHYIDLLSM